MIIKVKQSKTMIFDIGGELLQSYCIVLYVYCITCWDQNNTHLDISNSHFHSLCSGWCLHWHFSHSSPCLSLSEVRSLHFYQKLQVFSTPWAVRTANLLNQCVHSGLILTCRDISGTTKTPGFLLNVMFPRSKDRGSGLNNSALVYPHQSGR